MQGVTALTQLRPTTIRTGTEPAGGLGSSFDASGGEIATEGRAMDAILAKFVAMGEKPASQAPALASAAGGEEAGMIHSLQSASELVDVPAGATKKAAPLQVDTGAKDFRMPPNPFEGHDASVHNF